MGGIGKTSLSTKFAQQVAAHFDVVIWRSLHNAPRLEEILNDCFQLLMDQQSTSLPQVLGFVISTTTFSYVLIFPAFLVLRYKYPKLRRPYKVPGGMIGAWIVTLLPFAYAALASYVILVPTDATVSNYTGISRTTYELT